MKCFSMLTDAMRANADRPSGHKVVLLGSRSRGNAKLRSDADLGVFGDTRLPLVNFFAIEDMLDELPTRYRIDSVDFPEPVNDSVQKPSEAQWCPMSESWIIDDFAAALDQLEVAMQIMPTNDLSRQAASSITSSHLNLHGYRSRLCPNKQACKPVDHQNLVLEPPFHKDGLATGSSGWKYW